MPENLRPNCGSTPVSESENGARKAEAADHSWRFDGDDPYILCDCGARTSRRVARWEQLGTDESSRIAYECGVIKEAIRG